MAIDYSAVLADLDERIAKLVVARDAIREIAGEAKRPSASGQHPAGRGRVSTKKPRTGTVGALAFEIVRQHGGPMKVADIVKMLQAMGKSFKTINPRSNYGTVYGTLAADVRFVRVGEGAFDIRERTATTGNPA